MLGVDLSGILEPVADFDPHSLLGRFVYVDGVPGKDKRPRTREGLVKGCIEVSAEPRRYNLEVLIYGGASAEPNTMLVVPFESTAWRLRFPDKK